MERETFKENIKKRNIANYYKNKAKGNIKKRNIDNYYKNKAKENIKKDFKKDATDTYYKNEAKEDIKKDFKKDATDNYYKSEAQVDKLVQIYRDLAKEDIMYRIVNNLSTRENNSVEINNLNLTHLELIGCGYDQLKEHIQIRFKDGMSFDNYGDWEMDHIIPVSKFDMNNIEDIKKCFHFSNLQPLWKPENRKKYNKILL